MKSKRIPALVVGLAALLATGAVQGEVEIIPGSACVEEHGLQSGIEYGSGRARNTAETDKLLICPVVRDLPTGTTVDGRVNVTAASAYAVTCNLRCCTNAGLSCDIDAATASAGAGNSTLSFAAITAVSNGPCTVSCNLLGTDDRLRWYEITE